MSFQGLRWPWLWKEFGAIAATARAAAVNRHLLALVYCAKRGQPNACINSPSRGRTTSVHGVRTSTLNVIPVSHQAAIDHDGRACHACGLVRAEVDGRVGYLFGRDHAAQRLEL
jgi:hypothetical protein